MRASSVQKFSDAGGVYEVEIFDCEHPKKVIVTAHGNGVRRWDGEKFFYAVAEELADCVVALVDQNQTVGNGCRLNSLQVMTARVQQLITLAKEKYPGVSIVVMGHSMGCGIVTQLDLSGVEQVIFAAPAAGAQAVNLKTRYGLDKVTEDIEVKTSDGLIKIISSEYVASVQGIVWEDEYAKLLQRYANISCFESGAEEIVGEERFKHRELPFKKYEIIEGANHNLRGEALEKFFTSVKELL